MSRPPRRCATPSPAWAFVFPPSVFDTYRFLSAPLVSARVTCDEIVLTRRVSAHRVETRAYPFGDRFVERLIDIVAERMRARP